MTRLPSTSNGYAFIYGLLDYRPTENALRSSDEFKDNLGGAFNGLLEARILSDYSGRLEPNSAISDGKGKLSRTKARTLIDDAKKAIAFINALDQEARRRLVDTLVLRRKRK